MISSCATALLLVVTSINLSAQEIDTFAAAVDEHYNHLQHPGNAVHRDLSRIGDGAHGIRHALAG